MINEGKVITDEKGKLDKIKHKAYQQVLHLVSFVCLSVESFTKITLLKVGALWWRCSL